MRIINFKAINYRVNLNDQRAIVDTVVIPFPFQLAINLTLILTSHSIGD